MAKTFALLGSVQALDDGTPYPTVYFAIENRIGETSLFAAVSSATNRAKIQRIRNICQTALAKAEIPKKSWPKKADYETPIVLKLTLREREYILGLDNVAIYGLVEGETTLDQGGRIDIKRFEIIIGKRGKVSLEGDTFPISPFLDLKESFEEGKFAPIVQSRFFKGIFRSLPAVNIIGDGIAIAGLMSGPPRVRISELPGDMVFTLPAIYGLGNMFWGTVGYAGDWIWYVGKPNRRWGEWIGEMRAEGQ